MGLLHRRGEAGDRGGVVMSQDLERLRTPVTASEMSDLVSAIPKGGETETLHWVARRMAL